MKKILFIVSLFICGIVKSQIYTPSVPTAYGQNFLRIKAFNVLHVPNSGSDTSLNTSDTSSQLRIINGKLMYHFGYWREATGTGGGGGGGGTELDPVWLAQKNGYYTIVNLQTSGQAAVHWGNITNTPSFVLKSDSSINGGYYPYATNPKGYITSSNLPIATSPSTLGGLIPRNNIIIDPATGQTDITITNLITSYIRKFDWQSGFTLKGNGTLANPYVGIGFVDSIPFAVNASNNSGEDYGASTGIHRSSGYSTMTYAGTYPSKIPAASIMPGRFFMYTSRPSVIVITSYGTNDFYLNGTSSSSYTVNSGKSAMLISDGVKWNVMEFGGGSTGGGTTYTGNAPIVVSGLTISADTTTSITGLATKGYFINYGALHYQPLENQRLGTSSTPTFSSTTVNGKLEVNWLTGVDGFLVGDIPNRSTDALIVGNSTSATADLFSLERQNVQKFRVDKDGSTTGFTESNSDSSNKLASTALLSRRLNLQTLQKVMNAGSYAELNAAGSWKHIFNFANNTDGRTTLVGKTIGVANDSVMLSVAPEDGEIGMFTHTGNWYGRQFANSSENTIETINGTSAQSLRTENRGTNSLATIFYDATASPQGIKYNGNYHSTQVARSLVDKGYVDSIFSSIGGGGGAQLVVNGTLSGLGNDSLPLGVNVDSLPSFTLRNGLGTGTQFMWNRSDNEAVIKTLTVTGATLTSTDSTVNLTVTGGGGGGSPVMFSDFAEHLYVNNSTPLLSTSILTSYLSGNYAEAELFGNYDCTGGDWRRTLVKFAGQTIFTNFIYPGSASVTPWTLKIKIFKVSSTQTKIVIEGGGAIAYYASDHIGSNYTTLTVDNTVSNNLEVFGDGGTGTSTMVTLQSAVIKAF